MTEQDPQSQPQGQSSGSGSGGAGATGTSASGGVGRVVDGYRAMPPAERILGAAAATFLLSFVIQSRWKALFAFQYPMGWFTTLGFLGSILVLALMVTRLAGVSLLEPRMHVRTLVVLALLPAIGFLIDALKDFWSFMLLLAMVVMAYAAARITTREHIISR